MFTESGQFFTSPSGGYEIEQSIRFNDDDSAHLSKTFGSAGNRKTWTLSWWVKRANLGMRTQMFAVPYALGVGQFIIEFGNGDGDDPADDKIIFNNEAPPAAALNWELEWAFRDPAAWYHFVAVLDTTQSTANDRFKVYVNGAEATEGWDRNSTPDQNTDYTWNNALEHKIGGRHHSSVGYFDGYLTEIHFIDSAAKEASDFGQYNDHGVWIPKKYSGAYGSQGFHITGADSSDLGADVAGSNNFSSSGLAAADQMPDTPTLNHWTLNPLDSGGTLANGNLQNKGGSSTNTHAFAFPKTGKWYVEIDCIDINTGTSGAHFFGVCDASVAYSASFSDHAATSAGQQRGGQLKKDNSNTSSGTAVNDGDVIALAFDADNLTLDLYVNNSASGSQITGLTNVQYKLWIQDGGAVTNMQFKFAEASFEYTPPTGFKALSTANLPDPAIVDPSAHFQTTLYTGNGSTQSITNTGNSNLQPDLVWIKNRSATDSHVLTDSVRGATKIISSDATTAESTDADTVTAFASDGFALGADDKVNTSSENYVAWQWKESATAGFDIVTDTGTGSAHTISHSLGVTPELIMRKDRTATADPGWVVWHKDLGGANYYLNLHDSGARDTSVNYWNNTLPTSSVFSVGASNGTNQNTKTFVTYLFASVPGFSSIGTYEGNGNADGSFIYTGFSPAFLLVKNIDAAESWNLRDNKRDPFNVTKEILVPNTNAAEATSGGGQYADLLSNGFKLRGTDPGVNSSATFIYMAFAENPFGGDGIAPATAR